MAVQMVMSMIATMLGIGRDEDGQTMAEYGLLLAGIAVVVMVAVLLLGPAIANTFQDVINSL